MPTPVTYRDHVGLWAEELRDWVPDEIFDAHVHLGPPEAMGPLSDERRGEALGTFTDLTWEELRDWYRHLYAGKRIVGLIAFPMPLREVDMEAANDYIASVCQANPDVRGFVLSHPTDVPRTIAMFEAAAKRGVRFSGVKPYFDLLGKSNYDTTMPEFIPEDLLAFMNAEHLVMMLHTSGLGMVDPDNQAYIAGVVDKYPNVKIVLAHMGRYLKKEDYLAYLDTGQLAAPTLYLGMSSATEPDVYARTLEHRHLWEKLIFGSDMPFATLTGVEYCSEETGPTFLCRDEYPWTDAAVHTRFADRVAQLSYNTYHVIKSLKEACRTLKLDAASTAYLKTRVFRENARSLFA